MSVQKTEITSSLGRCAGKATSEYHSSIVVEPTVRSCSRFDDAETDVSAVR